MRKLYFTIVALMCCVVCHCKVVDTGTARRAALRILSPEAGRVGEEVRTKASAGAPAYYVFQDNRGWVVIAGDDCAVPVLAQGDGAFPEELPDAMRELLGGYEAEIIFARENGIEADEQTREMWENPESAEDAVTVGPYTAAIKWNQSGSPYDDKTPLVNDRKSPAGCVATAMAIVMRYNKWPQKGKGTLPSYSYGSGTIPELSIDGYVYDWDSMPVDPRKGGTDEGKAAIATLLAHLGQSVKMDYGASSSGAYGSSIPPALRKYFSYSNALVRLFRRDYSTEEWFHMLRKELDKGRPMIYCAASSNGGHSFVCDGYNLETKMISVNFGWGGGGNGWYVLNTVRSISNGDAAARGGYPLEHEAIFGMVPDNEGPVTDLVSNWIGLRIDASKGAYGMSYSSSQPVVRGSDFGVDLNRFANFYSVQSMKYRMVLADRDNNVKEHISGEKDLSFVENGAVQKYRTGSATCRINGDFVVGDRIRCQFSTTGGAVWYPLGCTTDQISTSEIRAMHEMGVYDLDIIDLPSDLKEGRALYFNVLYGGHKAYKSVKWTYDGVEVEDKYPSVILRKGFHTLKALVTYVDDTVRTIVSEFTVSD